MYLTNEEMLHLDRELFGDNNPFSFLRPCFMHITTGNQTVLALRSQMLGATMCDLDDLNLTHVVVPKTMDPVQVQEIKKQLTDAKVAVVSTEWLEKCFAQEKLVSDTIFAM